MRRWVLMLSWLLLACPPPASGRSVARQWNEATLRAIRADLARPTVAARNLFHVSIAMYDAWSAFDGEATPYLLGKTVGGFTCPFTGFPATVDTASAREEAISYAAYRVLHHRFERSPAATSTLPMLDSLMRALGYDPSFTSEDYRNGSAAALGNYIGESVIAYGLQDGANEANGYAYQYYEPVNPPLNVRSSGDSTLLDPNRWQPLWLPTFVDQNGNRYPDSTPKFLSPEWGDVTPFALTSADLTVHERGGHSYNVYDDPGPPPLFDIGDPNDSASQLSRWAYTLVLIWSSHLRGLDDRAVDISPASIGNNGPFPTDAAGLPAFYDLYGGGDRGAGRPMNPRTGEPYAPEYVPRGDYARVLAEFWADGPTSETPPGHWFTILNYVSDQPALAKRFKGEGRTLDDLEWDVKAYFALGGAVHDAAIAAWSIKGWYDSIRPISVIRWMAQQGQSSEPGLPHYSPLGLPLIPGYIELVEPGDRWAVEDSRNLYKIKALAWQAADSVSSPASDTAGVGWVLAERWWPYQRQTFVTPPFAGYVSGHSTYSRAAAEVLTALTGDEFFPGGMGSFYAPRNQFLVFEDGPSVDVTLEWATYRDAADQCSLSRIWGGIHAPLDDIPGRRIGESIGRGAFALAERYMSREGLGPPPEPSPMIAVAPNPVRAGVSVTARLASPLVAGDVAMYSVTGQQVPRTASRVTRFSNRLNVDTRGLAPGVYLLRVHGPGGTGQRRFVVL